MAPKRKLKRKTGIHTLSDTPPSKKAKTTRSTPKATGLHTLAGSDTKSKAYPSEAAPKKGLHTLANVSDGHNSTNTSRGRMSHSADDQDDGDDKEKDGDDGYESSDTDENPLFWTFPMQGRPMIPDSENLENVGFAFIRE